MGCTIVGLVTTNASCIAIFTGYAYRQGIAIWWKSNWITEIIIHTSIRGLDIGLLAPSRTRTGKDVYRTTRACTIVGLVTTNASCIAIFTVRAYRQGIAIWWKSNWITEIITSISIRGLDIGLLAPSGGSTRIGGGGSTGKYVYRAIVASTIVGLVTINASCIAIFTARAYRQGIAIWWKSNWITEIITSISIRGLGIGFCKCRTSNT